MIIEVLSPGNSRHDLVRKKELYEEFGVKEYWAIDPDTKETTGFLLKGGIFESQEAHLGRIHSALLDQTFIF